MEKPYHYYNTNPEYKESRIKKRLLRKEIRHRVKNYIKEHKLPFGEGMYFLQYPDHFVMENAMWKFIVYDDKITAYDKILKVYLDEE